jgi:hypothetical protein
MEQPTLTLVQAVLIALFGGFIGSIVGAAIGAYATLKATKKSLDGLWNQEREKRRYDQKQQEKAVVEALLKELKENVIVATAVLEKGKYFTKMSREAWANHKGNISFLTTKLQGNLPHTYHLIAIFNGYVEYNMVNLDYGSGAVNDDIRKSAEEFKGNAGGVIDAFEQLLS